MRRWEERFDVKEGNERKERKSEGRERGGKRKRKERNEKI